MEQLFAPRAFGSKTCVVRVFVVTPDTHSFIHSRFSLSSSEASREPRFSKRNCKALSLSTRANPLRVLGFVLAMEV